MKILVTGGCGYIGSHTVVKLLEEKFEVVIIDNLVNSKREVLEKIKKITGSDVTFYQEDLCNLEELRKTYKFKISCGNTLFQIFLLILLFLTLF